MTNQAQQMWDERYSAAEPVWSSTPNVWVEAVAGPLPVGTVLDLGAGEGRNALWLAERGWQATAVDFSAVGLQRAEQWAAERLGADASRLSTVVADLTSYDADQAYDLVMVIYIHLPAEQRAEVMRRAAAAVAPGGTLLVVAHDSDNLEHGVGGPQDAAVLYTADDVVADLDGTGLTPVRTERVVREVQTAEGPRQALDALAVLRRP